MKVFVDEDLCIGCGVCVDLEPSVFQMNDNGKAEAYREAIGGAEENTQQAIDLCPVTAISEV